MRSFSSFYFLHIPKTAGRFFSENVMLPIEKHLNEKNIKNIKLNFRKHNGWGNFIDDNTYVSTIFRDPVEQAISFFCHSLILDKDGKTIINKNGIDKINYKDFMYWTNKNKNMFSNFQSKNLLFEVGGESTFFKNLDNQVVNISVLQERIKHIDLMLKTNHLNTSKNILLIRKKILNDLSINIENTDSVFFINNKEVEERKKYFLNSYSNNFYKSLTEKQKEEIYKINEIDSEIFFTKSNFYNLEDEKYATI